MEKVAKTKGRLVEELTRLRQRIAELEGSETEHKRTNRLLQKALEENQESQNKIDAILKSVDEGLIITDLQNRIVLINQPAEKFLGISIREVINHPIDSAFKNHPFKKQLLAALSSRAPGPLIDMELPGQDPPSPLALKIKTSEILNKAGQPVSMVIVLHDMTKEREIERIKSEFISTAAHELRTPLTSVLGFSELLLANEEFEPEKRKQCLSYIYQKARVLARIVDELLEIGRVEAGDRISLRQAPCDMGDIIAQLVSQYQWEFSRYKFEVVLPEDSFHAMVDKMKILQVLENILTNAVKYSPPESRIRITAVKIANSLQVSVKDEGIGLNPEQMERVFDKFYRADSSNTAVGGMGLGLTITKNIVEAHKGKIWVESQPGAGTILYFTIPAIPIINHSTEPAPKHSLAEHKTIWEKILSPFPDSAHPNSEPAR
jgi:PAS domain S-box-containing protein